MRTQSEINNMLKKLAEESQKVPTERLPVASIAINALAWVLGEEYSPFEELTNPEE